ncbi:MAG TPA: hypothetical protein VI815_04695 [Candidatus Nanoarchaeia archaeon]|nr:hypothetical protein [Candidatus Nanoarchaeia archaeon]
MKQINQNQAEKNNLKIIKTISVDDMSKAILAIERLKEDKKIKYYSIDSIIFNQITHKGEFNVSFWGLK